ncbi:hypothetical protein FD725_14650 [Nostoc sp. TCL26-01]|nr:hypothetical protein FD725_14650 [Nostoc sp. TCL26-01]
MKNNQKHLHYLALICIIPVGIILRFWHLDLKPLWMDEVITAIFSLGKNYQDVPLDVAFPLQNVQEIFTFHSGVSCPQIADNLAKQSTHPPLFFCGMYRWLGWLMPLGDDWVRKLRSLPALFGVGAIAAMYTLNRIAFSAQSGMIAAWLMAVSPFAVYLSQEARHYTLPMLLINLSLVGLVQIQRDIAQGRWKFWVWFLWVVVNTLGFYVHYFCILAFIAEVATLIILIYWGKSQLIKKHQIWLAIIISTSAVVLSFLPWIVITISHARRSETSWLPPTNFLAPLYQTLINWVLMVITLPVENQPLIITVICGLVMVIFAIWAGSKIFRGLKKLWLNNTASLATFTLLSFTGFVLLELLAIAYLSGKDITAIPRYSFVYYPGFCALLAASLSTREKSSFKGQKLILIFILVSLLSSIFVVTDLAFQKPFQPEQVAQKMNLSPSLPIILVVAYDNYQDVALGLSFALALDQARGKNSQADSLAFLQKAPDISSFWKKFSRLSTSATSPLNLWIVAPGLRRRDYLQQLTLSEQNICQIDPKQHYRIGIPYQLYRCGQG